MFGKLPKVGDFVRVGMSNEATRGFEEWLHKGVQYAHEKRGSSWKTTFLGGQSYASVFRVSLASGQTGLLAALISPSQDSVGRAFPLTTYVSLPDDMPLPLVPQVLGTFLDDAMALASRAPELAATDAGQSLHSLGVLEDVARVAPIYDNWVRSTRLSEMWRAIYGSEDSTSPAYAFYLLYELARTLRGRDASSSPLAFRVPLGRAGVTAASFWLDAVRASLQWRANTPTFFWTFNGYDGDLLVQLGRTPPSSFLELWWADPRNEAMTTVIGARPWGDSMSRIPPAVRRCLERPHAMVTELFDALWTS